MQWNFQYPSAVRFSQILMPRMLGIPALAQALAFVGAKRTKKMKILSRYKIPVSSKSVKYTNFKSLIMALLEAPVGLDGYRGKRLWCNSKGGKCLYGLKSALCPPFP